jgi:hypothetical protein
MKVEHVFLRKYKGINIFPICKELLETYTQVLLWPPLEGCQKKKMSLTDLTSIVTQVILFTLQCLTEFPAPTCNVLSI